IGTAAAIGGAAATGDSGETGDTGNAFAGADVSSGANSGAVSDNLATSGSTGGAFNLVSAEADGGEGGDGGVALAVNADLSLVDLSGGAANAVFLAGVDNVSAVGGSSVATAAANGGPGGDGSIKTSPN